MRERETDFRDVFPWRPWRSFVFARRVDRETLDAEEKNLMTMHPVEALDSIVALIDWKDQDVEKDLRGIVGPWDGDESIRIIAALDRLREGAR